MFKIDNGLPSSSWNIQDERVNDIAIESSSIFARILEVVKSCFTKLTEMEVATNVGYPIGDISYNISNVSNILVMRYSHEMAGAATIPGNIYNIAGFNALYGLNGVIQAFAAGVVRNPDNTIDVRGNLDALLGLVGSISQMIGGLGYIVERPLNLAADYSKQGVKALAKATHITAAVAGAAFGVYYAYMLVLGLQQLIKTVQSLPLFSHLEKGEEGKILADAKKRKILVDISNERSVRRLEKVAKEHLEINNLLLDCDPKEKKIWYARCERTLAKRAEVINEISYTRRIKTIIALSFVIIGVLGLITAIGFFTGGLGVLPFLGMGIALAVLLFASDAYLLYDSLKARKATEGDEKAIKVRIAVAVVALVAAVVLTAVFTGGISLIIALACALIGGIGWIALEGYALHKIREFRKEGEDNSLEFFLKAIRARRSEEQLVEIFSRLAIQDQMSFLAKLDGECRYEFFMALGIKERLAIFEELDEDLRESLADLSMQEWDVIVQNLNTEIIDEEIVESIRDIYKIST